MPRKTVLPSAPSNRRAVAVAARAATAAILLAAPSFAHASIADAPRGYELVSPPGIGSRAVSNLPPTGPWTAPITPSGEVLARVQPSIPGGAEETQGTLLHLRREATGWSRRQIVVPQATFRHDDVSVLAGAPDLSTVVLEPLGPRPLPQETLLPGTILPGDPYLYLFAAGADRPLTWLSDSGSPRDWAGDVAAGDTQNLPSFNTFLSDDGRTSAFLTRASLTPDIPTGLGVEQLYRRRGATIEPIAKRPDGSLATGGGVSLRGMSADGDVVLFDDAYALQPDATTAADLVVVTPTGSKLANRPRLTVPGSPRASSGATWATLTPDGATVVFATREPLTDSDTDASIDLYRYTVATDTLTHVTRASGGAPGGNADDCSAFPDTFSCDVVGGMVSRDGQTTYFFAREQLDGSTGAPQAAALYVADGDGPPRFIATLPAKLDAWIDNLSTQYSSRGSFEVTAQRDLVFETIAPLPGSPAYDLNPRTQVWRYDHSAGSLTCLSCRRSGGTPEGPTTLSASSEEGVKRGTSSVVTLPTGGGSPRVTADGSTVFVTSYDRLVDADRNSSADVYAIDVASRTPHLITTGRGERDSYLMGVDADGSNAFFITTDALDPTDDNGPTGKLYVARIGGGFAAPPAGGEQCRGAACRVIAEAPSAAGNASQGAAPDPSAPPEDLDPELATPSAKARAAIATRGRLAVTATHVVPGAVVSLRVRVRLSSRSSVSTTVTSRGGTATRTLTAKFTRAQRLRIASGRRKRTLPVELRLDHRGDPVVVSTSIARVKKGR